MALKPFERRVGSPRAVPLTPVRQVNIPDIGPQIRQAANVLAEYGVKGMSKEAEEQGIADAAAAQFARDENGNLVMPEPTGGGETYRNAFLKASGDRYVAEVESKLQIDLNRIYYGEGSSNKTPDQLAQEADLLVRSVIDNVNPILKPVIASLSLREFNQRDLRARGEFKRKQDALNQESYETQISNALSDALDLSVIGTSESITAFTGKLNSALQAAKGLIDLELQPSGYLQEVQERFDSVFNYGSAFRVAMDRVNSGELDVASLEAGLNVISGTDVEGKFLNRTYSDFANVIQRDDRANLIRRLGGEIDRLKKLEEAESKTTAEFLAKNDFEYTGSIPLGTPPSVIESLTDSLLKNNGYNPEALTYEAVSFLTTHFQVIDQIPAKYFERLKNVSSASLEQIQEAMPLYMGLRSPLTGDGTIGASLAHKFLSNKEIAFMENIIIAQSFGAGDPVERARNAVKNYDETLDSESTARTLLNKSAGGANEFKLLLDEAYENADIVIEAMQNDDKKELLIYAAQLASGEVPTAQALRLAVGKFKDTRVLVTEQNHAAIAGSKTGPFYARRDEVFPDVEVLDRNNRLVKDNNVFAEKYISLALKNEQLPSEFKLDDVKVGENIFVQAVPDSNGLFFVIRDTEDQGRDIVRNEKGMPVLVNLGLAARVQQAAVDDWKRTKQRAEDELVTLRRRAYPPIEGGDKITRGWSFLGTPVGTVTPPRRRDEKAIAEYEQAKKEFDETYNTPAETVMGVNPLTGGSSRFAVGERRLVMEEYPTDIAVEPSRKRFLERDRRKDDDRAVVREVAAQLGVSPVELTAILMLESNLSPSIVNQGGYTGLYQMSADVQAAFKLNRDSSFADQLRSLPLYLKGGTFNNVTLQDTEYKPGMGWQKLYRAIVGGKYNSDKDDKNGTMASKFPLIRQRLEAAERWLEGR